MKNFFTILLLCLFSLDSFAATMCVGPSSSGGATGADWNNKLAWSATPTRGDTWYLEDGSYTGKTLSVATSGSTLITIKKATVADHGTSTGWSDTMGDGQATFGTSSGISFTTGYWVFDGQTGGGDAAWTNGFGFRIAVTTTTSGPGINVAASVGNITARHFEIEGNGGDGDGSGTANDGFSLGTDSHDLTFSYWWARSMGRCITFHHGYNVIYEHFYGGDFESTAGQHSEWASIWRNVTTGADYITNTTIRYGVVAHSEGTGGIIGDVRGLYIYGVIFDEPAGDTWSAPNGVIGTWTGGNMVDVLIYNCSFNDTGVRLFGFLEASGDRSGCYSYNNIFYNETVDITGLTHDFNHYINSGGTHSEANGTSAASGDPFVSAAGLDFTLSAATAAGTTLASPYTTDPAGVTRGADGFWDRGAYEYASGGGGDVTAPSVSITSPTNNQPSVATSIAISGTSSDDTAVASVTLTNVSTATGFTVTGTTSWSATAMLAYGSNYIRAIATDSSGNKATNAIAVLSVNDTNTWASTRSPYLGVQYLQTQNPAAQHTLMSNVPATYVNLPITYAILTGGAYGGYGNGTNYYDATYALNTNNGWRVILQFSDMPTNKILDYLPYLTNRYRCWMVNPINENDDATVSSETIKYYRAVMPTMRLGGPALYHLKNPTYIDALVASGAFAMLDSFVGHDYLAVPLNGLCTSGWWTNSYYHPIDAPTDYHPEWSVGNLAARLAWMNSYTNLLRTNYTDTPKVMVTEYGIYQNNPEDGLYAGQIFRNMQIPAFVTANFATTNACPYNNALYDGVGVGYFTPSQQNFLKRIAPLSRGLGTITTDNLVIQ